MHEVVHQKLEPAITIIVVVGFDYKKVRCFVLRPELCTRILQDA